MEKVQHIWIVVTLYLAVSCVGYTKELPIASPEDLGMSAERLARVKPAVQALIESEILSGASVIVARKGEIVLFETLGMMDREAKKTMQRDTIFRIDSMTKPITSVAVMVLYEEGKLKLDDPVSKYIPEFKGLKVYAESGQYEEQVRQMIIRDLLRHTSGLTYGWFEDTVNEMYRDKDILSRESSLQDMIDKLSEIPLHHQPGTRFDYSISVDVLGYLVQKVSGQSLDEFFRQRIFKPLDMKDTDYYVPTEKVHRFAVNYGPKEDGGLEVVDDPTNSRYLIRPNLLMGGDGLVTTARDYMRFCQMLLNKGRLDGRQLLRSETVEMMTSNQLPGPLRIPDFAADMAGTGKGFGLGFAVRLEDNKFPKGEYGWLGGSSTFFWISPKDELIVIALTQYRPYSLRLYDAVKSIIYESIL